ncbi:MAG TPA: cupin domain-containing protein [Stellaceae bacterium]|nr:cupin domain-containing protein [Stellaceae bacterium]
MPKIDIERAPRAEGSGYPPPYDEPCRNRMRQRLGDAAGLTQFGVNRLVLKPGVWSAQRHWHTAEDEFVWVLSGEVVLVTDAGEEILRAGDCAAFKAGVADGHHLQNRSDAHAVVLEIGSRRPEDDACDYPDIDLTAPVGKDYCHKDGTPY